jgi:hypothetical protein
MKKLIMIAGPAGLGKTTVCQKLFETIDGCAWLDADWCWMVNPYPGKTDEQKCYAEKAFGYILGGYFNDDNTKIIFFSWLMHSDFMFDLVTSQISYKDYKLIKIVLVCEESEYIRRLIEGNRSENKIYNPDDMTKYRLINANIIDTTELSVEETADKILDIIK